MLDALKRYNVQLTLLSVTFAAIFGIFAPEIFSPIHFIGELFINLLKAFALPLICAALIAALGDMGSNIVKFKRLARNVVSYMFFSEIAAITIALVLLNLVKPGIGLNPDLILQGSNAVASNTEALSFSKFILAVFPRNFVESLAHFDILPVVVFSICFGIASSLVGDKAEPVVQLALSIREIAATCLNGIMLFGPLGIFSLIGSGIAQAHANGHLADNFFALLNFVVVLLIGMFLHAFWQLTVVVFTTKQSFRHVLKTSLPVLTTAFGTSSSVATLPIAMQTADDLKSTPTTTRFMLPLCASINIGGMMVYEVAAALFFSQMLGYDLSLNQQILMAFACILGGMATGGLPETSLVSMVVVFKTVNVPLSAISILLPLDRIIDRIRTMVNIFGNMCGVIIVSQLTRDHESS